MTDTEIWNAACERVGCEPSEIGNAAAMVAMVAWLAPSYAIIKKIDPNWQVNSGNWSPTLPLALASAVLAVPQETQP